MGRTPFVRINFGKLVVGFRGVNKSGYPFTVLEFLGRQGHEQVWKIQFDSGFIVDARKPEILSGGVKDRLSPSLYGIGIYGYPRDYIRKEYDLWKSILERCYKTDSTSYHGYGAKGATVCDRWHRFDYFLQDLPYIDGYDEELYNIGLLDLDKDKKQFNLPYHLRVYSPETCTFISRSENLRYTSYEVPRYAGIPYTVITSNDEILDFDSKGECIEMCNISDYLLSKYVNTNVPYNGNRYYTSNDVRIIGRNTCKIYGDELYEINEMLNTDDNTIPVIRSFERSRFSEYQPIQGKITVSSVDC